MSAPAYYRRGSGGRVIHLECGCHWANGKGTFPWPLHEGHSVSQIIGALEAKRLLPQIRFCYFCFGRLPAMEITERLKVNP